MLITAAFLNWQLMLVMLGCIPFIGASVGILTQMMSSTTQEGNDHYSKAGGVATEVGTVSLKRAMKTLTCLLSFDGEAHVASASRASILNKLPCRLPPLGPLGFCCRLWHVQTLWGHTAYALGSEWHTNSSLSQLRGDRAQALRRPP